MSLTVTEEKRLREAEETLNSMLQSLEGASSSNKLNRLYILLDRELKRIERAVDSLESRTSEILELARKVQ
jgi:hypothetical protein